MNGILTSENFKKFMENITVDNYSNIKDMESGFKKHLQLISKEIKLGQISIVYIAPKTPQNPEGLRSFQILFIAPEGFEDEPYEENFGTGEGGTMTLTFNPLPDVEWTEAELKEIDLIGQIFFIVTTKTRAAFPSTVNAIIIAPNTINGERRNRRRTRFTPACT